MKTVLLSFTLFLLVFLSKAPYAFCQESLYNINKTNGLHSNHVYNFSVDKYGYLWIATDKGVFKYNGYDFKVFNLGTGLAEEDVWHMYEDNKERLWLMSISSEIGYISRDRYKKTVTDNSSKVPRIRPKDISNHSHGIKFMTRDDDYYLTSYLCYERNDTLKFTPVNIGHGWMWLMYDGTIIWQKNNKIYHITWKNGRPVSKYICTVAPNNFFLYRTNLVPHPFKAMHGKKATIVDTRDCSQKDIALEAQEDITMINPYRSRFYITTSKRILVYDTAMNLLHAYRHEQLTAQQQSEDVVTIIEDATWGTCTATSQHGLYIDMPQIPFKAVHDYNTALDGYQYLGRSADNKLYWWNKITSQIISTAKDKKITSETLYQGNINKLIPYDSNRSMLIAKYKYNWIYKDGHVESVFDNIRIAYHDSIVKNYGSFVQPGGNLKDAIWLTPYILYATTLSTGFDSIYLKGDTLISRTLKHGRYPHMTYSQYYKIFINYDSRYIYIHGIKGKKAFQVSSEVFDILGLKKIENIKTDDFGNIFIKTYDKLVLYNPSINYYRELLTEYKMTDAIMEVDNNSLLMGTKYGIAYCTVKGAGDVSQPFLYRNPKYQYYNYCEHIFNQESSFIVQTDRGFYELDKPKKQEKQHKQRDDYNLLLSYNDSTIKIGQQDTVTIQPESYNIKFDVIKKTGTGKVKYTTRLRNIDSLWQEQPVNEFNIPFVEPDNYYTLDIRFSDDTWRSQSHSIVLYMQPYWWQSKTARRLFWISGILGGLVIAYSIVFFTKKIVTRKQQKINTQLELRNLKLALELKSIYSQINPHFIFNTLGTALYFIKKQRHNDAYEHIASFSDLLRSYIKSSRNRYISIAEEIENLENYLLLQSARFENKFDYSIVVDEQLQVQSKMIPSLLLQPLVENALNHGMFHKEGKGMLLIEFKWYNDKKELTCIIDDNGIGRSKSHEINSKKTAKNESYGTDLINTLIDIFNTHEDTKIAINYIDKTLPLTGTTVILTISNPK